MCISPLKPQSLSTGLVETRWLNAAVRLRSKIYSICRCDDTDNVAPRDRETSNVSIETRGGRSPKISFVPLNFLIPRKICFKNIIKTKIVPPENAFCPSKPQNLAMGLVGSYPEFSPSQRARMCCSI